MQIDKFEALQAFLEEKHDLYNRPEFIPLDPISIPHQYQRLQDIEITGFWAAILAWGQRPTILKKCQELFVMMDQAPYDFIMNHQEEDLKPFEHFKHRTFNGTDTLYFISFFKNFYQQHTSLEEAFVQGISSQEKTTEKHLNQFRKAFFADPWHPPRTMKHVASPDRKSACKRINMFLRWMVRKDNRGVDFGLWKSIRPDQLVCPCDLHVDRVARQLGLIQRKQSDWQMALELTENLRKFDPNDPVKYDFSLFGAGVVEKYGMGDF